ncbi:MAG: hypothetical protein QOH26_1384 [Actinomycetota bacterium]|jgi:hypothetical protein|nr:hypothetical protein [Actinomycetota bacterium]
MMRSSFRDQRRAGTGIRLAVLLLAVSALFPGVWALASPRSFFLHFPGLGQEWTRAFPPYNEHLVRDIGSFFLAIGVLLGTAAVTADRRTIRVALFTYLVFSIPHAIWHGQHLTGSGSADRWGPVGALIAGIALSVGLLFAIGRRR